MRRFLAITPFFIISIGFFIYALYPLFIEIVDSDSEGWGLVLFGIIFICFIGFLIADLLIKLFVRTRKKVIKVQIFLLVIFGIYYLLSEVKQTIHLPKNFDKTYVTIVFDVDGEPQLPSRLSPFHDSVLVNKDGFILTSSTLPNSIFGNENYTIKDEKGEVIGSKGNAYHLTTFPVYVITHSNQEYTYLTFKIEPRKKGCCGYSGTEISEHYKQVEKYLNKHFD